MIKESTQSVINKLEEVDCLLTLYDKALLERTPEKLAQEYVDLVIGDLVKTCGDFEADCKDGAALATAKRRFYKKFTTTIFMNSPFLNHIYSKPYGYAGDFKAIDMIYKNSMEGRGIVRLIERHSYDTPACKAVRNRKDFILKTIREEFETGKDHSLLNLACGPAREIAELAEDGRYKGTCKVINIDVDSRAIAYAKSLLNGSSANIEVRYAIDNVLKMALRSTNIDRYGLQEMIVCLGLFDYLEEKWAVRVLRALYDLLSEGGLMVIGNFSDKNPSRVYMEWIGDWHIIYRTKAEFRYIFEKAGLFQVDIVSEPLGINLFGIVRKG